MDPSVPARHWSLHLYPQNVFPSKQNEKLHSDLEVPYAFSHIHNAFYWTKDDALANLKLNIWAKPPCLNCELVGETDAQKCDRHEKQHDSDGKIQCCTKCKLRGDEWGCIEQVEIRADANYTAVNKYTLVETENAIGSKKFRAALKRGHGIFNPDAWCSEEQELRDNGLVWWQPINLACGDADRKEQIVEQLMQQDGRRDFTPVRKGFPPVQMSSKNVSWRKLKLKANPRWRRRIDDVKNKDESWNSGRSEDGALEERMSLGREINRRLVAEWSQEEDEFGRQAARAQEDEMIRRRESADKESMLELERKKLHWSEEIRIARTRQYYQDVEDVGREVANLFLEAWEGKRDRVILQANRFLELKKYWMQQGLEEEDAIPLCKAELLGKGEEVADCVRELEDLVPHIFRADV
jgi:hypothetical protein